MATAWDCRLSEPLKPSDGHQLKTLRDAARMLSGCVGRGQHAMQLDHAIDLLLRAAESGKACDIEAATEQVSHMLRVKKVDVTAA